MAIEHVDITDPDIHEPKGVADANADEVYIADGLGSGGWGSVPLSLVISVVSFSSSGTWTKPAGLVYVKSQIWGSGGGAYSGGNAGTSGGTSSFGSHHQVTGGGGSDSGGFGAGGVASNGNLNVNGLAGSTPLIKPFPYPPLIFGGYGIAGEGVGANARFGGTGGNSVKYIAADDLGATETVTVGNGGIAGSGGGSSSVGGQGFIVIEQYIKG